MSPRLDVNLANLIADDLCAGLAPLEVVDRHRKVSKSAIYRIWKNVRELGRPYPLPHQRNAPAGRRRVITPAMEADLVETLSQRPTMEQSEIAQHLLVTFRLHVSESTISRAIRRPEFALRVAERVAAQRDGVAGPAGNAPCPPEQEPSNVNDSDEGKAPPRSKTMHAPPRQYRSPYSPMPSPTPTKASETPAPTTRPRAGTRASIALSLIDEWTAVQAEALYSSPNRRFPMPSSAYMDTVCRWQLAYLYNEQPTCFWDTLTADVLCAEAPLLLTWSHRETSEQLLVEQLQRIARCALGVR